MDAAQAMEESTGRKICKMVCLAIPLAFSIVMLLISYQLAGRAMALNEQQDPTGIKAIKPYDTCDTLTFSLPLADLGLGDGELQSYLDGFTNDMLDGLDSLEGLALDNIDFDLEWDEDWGENAGLITDSLDGLDSWAGD